MDNGISYAKTAEKGDAYAHGACIYNLQLKINIVPGIKHKMMPGIHFCCQNWD